ncbi:hypothetical protein Tco_1338906 [Tanacetum coccineum]
MIDAKHMWDAIKSRFGGNDESKKMHKYILKQQFKGFSVSPLKMLIKSSLGLYLLPGPNGLHLDHKDLEQLDEFNLEEMDLKWQLAMISMRLKKFYKKTRRKLHFDAKEPSDEDVDKFGLRFANIESMHAVPPLMTDNILLQDLLGTSMITMFTYAVQKQSDALIIEEYESDSDDEYVIQPSKEQENLVLLFFSHLIRDCDFHEKRMAKQVELNKKKGKGTGQGENRPVWNNVQRVNHQNQFVPTAVLTRTGRISVNTASHNFNSQAVSTSAARKVNAIRHICKKQTIVATSTTKANYVAAANCYGQVLWIQNQLLDYGFNFMNTKIYIDNESTICIVKNPVFHSKTKHIEIRRHFIRDAYEKKLIQVLKIHTDDNVADLLTKAFDVSRNLDPKKFLMYPWFLQLFLNNQLKDLPESFNDTYETPCYTKKVFTNMARKGVKFSGKVTLLFDVMLVPHQAPEGKGLEQPTKPQPTPSPTHLSTRDQPPVTDSSSSHDTTQDSRDSLEDTNKSEGTQVQSSHDSPLLGDHTSEKAEGGLNLEELFVLCTNLSNRVLALGTFKDAQAAEILKLKDQIKKLKRKKESVSKQGRKNAKHEPTLDAFDDLDADGRDYMETEDVLKEGRQSNETEELNKGSGEKGRSTEELVSTVVPKIVSTARPELSTARPDVDAARQEDSVVDPGTPPTTTSIFDDEDITMAQTLIGNITNYAETRL